MAKIANVATSDTFGTWRTRSNAGFDRLSQFAITNSSLYANTVTANNNLNALKNATITKNLVVSGNTTSNKVVVTSSLTSSGNTTLSGPLTYGATTLSNSVTGTGSMVLATSPTLVTPALGVATATSVALGGATIGSNALAVTGTSLFTGSAGASAYQVLSTGSYGFAASIGGSTNMRIVREAASVFGFEDVVAATKGFSLSAATDAVMAVKARDGTTDAAVTAGAATLSAALTYGGVTLSNSVTGTGSMVLSTSPTLVTPALGVATATTLALGGATIGANVLATIGSAVCFAGAASGNATSIVRIFGGLSNSNGLTLTMNSATDSATVINGLTGSLGIGSNNSAALTFAATTNAVTISTATTLSAALTYGGVTLSNSVTGTGSMVLSTSPTIATSLTVSGTIQASSWIQAGAGGILEFYGRAGVRSPADSILTLTNNAATDFGRLQFGGTTSSFPAIKRSGTGVHIRLADDSDYSNLTGNAVVVNSRFEGLNATRIGPTSDGFLSVTNQAVTSGFAIDLTTDATVKFRNRANTADAALTAGATTLSAALTYGGVTLSNSVTGTGSMVLSASPTLTGTLNAATIIASGDITSNSDLALKSNIEPITGALDKLANIKGITFNSDGIASRRTGVIAQDVQTVLPEAVHMNADGHLSVAYGNMVGLLVEAIKELRAEIATLKQA